MSISLGFPQIVAPLPLWFLHSSLHLIMNSELHSASLRLFELLLFLCVLEFLLIGSLLLLMIGRTGFYWVSPSCRTHFGNVMQWNLPFVNLLQFLLFLEVLYDAVKPKSWRAVFALCRCLLHLLLLSGFLHRVTSRIAFKLQNDVKFCILWVRYVWFVKSNLSAVQVSMRQTLNYKMEDKSSCMLFHTHRLPCSGMSSRQPKCHGNRRAATVTAGSFSYWWGQLPGRSVVPLSGLGSALLSGVALKF